MNRWVALLTAALFVAAPALSPATALAVTPPSIPPGVPPAEPVAPLVPTAQKAACGTGTVIPGSRFDRPSTGQTMLGYTDAWRFSRGAGQKVAVIDTGVSPHPRLPALEGGGDYVSSTDGLVDCDAHGTLVAGLIAARPSPDDAFSGVAPEASILSIRQNSAAFAAEGPSSDPQHTAGTTSTGYGNTRGLAMAIVRAVDLGATVINLSEAACAPAGLDMDDATVGQAVRYAFDHNVVVVAAAGNVDKQGLCAVQNPVRDPNLPLSDAWRTVQTVASPAWFSDYVLTVGALSADGQPADFSLRGPWVSVAAPGENLTSLNPSGVGLMNAWPNPQGSLQAVNGTSFAAPYVSGVVALIRARFPQMSAQEVMDRVKRTAHTPQAGPDAAVGYGVVDPVAALTDDLPPASQLPNPSAGTPITAPPARATARIDRAHRIVLFVCGGCLALAVIAAATFNYPRRRKN
jgi:membrane-anchored mycosin MYCP